MKEARQVIGSYKIYPRREHADTAQCNHHVNLTINRSKSHTAHLPLKSGEALRGRSLNATQMSRSSNRSTSLDWFRLERAAEGLETSKAVLQGIGRFTTGISEISETRVPLGLLRQISKNSE